jgi:hypothetical protein
MYTTTNTQVMIQIIIRELQIKTTGKPGIEGHSYNPCTQKTEAERLRVCFESSLSYSETLSKTKQNTTAHLLQWPKFRTLSIPNASENMEQ